MATGFEFEIAAARPIGGFCRFSSTEVGVLSSLWVLRFLGGR